MKKSLKLIGIIAIVAIIGFTMIACNKSGGSSGGGGKTLNSPEALKEYLDSQPANSPDKPIKVSMGANELMLPKIKGVLNSAGKYVSLNLTGNALTTIPNHAFYECKTLVSITIPNSVTSIGEWAFKDCETLVSIILPDSVTSIDGYISEFSTNNITVLGVDKSLNGAWISNSNIIDTGERLEKMTIVFNNGIMATNDESGNYEPNLYLYTTKDGYINLIFHKGEKHSYSVNRNTLTLDWGDSVTFTKQ